MLNSLCNGAKRCIVFEKEITHRNRWEKTKAKGLFGYDVMLDSSVQIAYTRIHHNFASFYRISQSRSVNIEM